MLDLHLFDYFSHVLELSKLCDIYIFSFFITRLQQLLHICSTIRKEQSPLLIGLILGHGKKKRRNGYNPAAYQGLACSRADTMVQTGTG